MRGYESPGCFGHWYQWINCSKEDSCVKSISQLRTHRNRDFAVVRRTATLKKRWGKNKPSLSSRRGRWCSWITWERARELRGPIRRSTGFSRELKFKYTEMGSGYDAYESFICSHWKFTWNQIREKPWSLYRKHRNAKLRSIGISGCDHRNRWLAVSGIRNKQGEDCLDHLKNDQNERIFASKISYLVRKSVLRDKVVWSLRLIFCKRGRSQNPLTKNPLIVNRSYGIISRWTENCWIVLFA